MLGGMNMKKIIAFTLSLVITLSLAACVGQQRDLVDLESISLDGVRGVVWEDRVYAPFCVISKNDRGEQIGYVEGDTDDRISEYKGYPPEEWLVSWIPTDGGAMLLKEQSVVDIPEGLEAEY